MSGWEGGRKVVREGAGGMEAAICRRIYSTDLLSLLEEVDRCCRGYV